MVQDVSINHMYHVLFFWGGASSSLLNLLTLFLGDFVVKTHANMGISEFLEIKCKNSQYMVWYV